MNSNLIPEPAVLLAQRKSINGMGNLLRESFEEDSIQESGARSKELGKCLHIFKR